MRRFLLNLNVFLPAWLIGSLLVGPLLAMPLVMVAAALMRFGAGWGGGLLGASTPVGAVVVGGVLLMAWRRTGLSPHAVSRSRIGRFFIGHVLLALATLSASASLVVPMVVSAVTHDSRYLMLTYFAMLVVPLAGCLALSGLFMVLSAREPAKALVPPGPG